MSKTRIEKKVKSVLVGVVDKVDKMSETLQKVPPRMDMINQELGELNKLVKSLKTLGVMKGKQAEEYMKKIADKINYNLSPYINENKNIQDALKGLHELKAKVEEKINTHSNKPK